MWCMLSNAGLFKEFRGETVTTACFLVNQSPTSIGWKTLENVWSGKPATYSNIILFGCLAYVHVRDGKVDPRATKRILLGYAQGVKGYKLWSPNPKSPKFIISKDVTFNESTILHPSQQIDKKGDQSMGVHYSGGDGIWYSWFGGTWGCSFRNNSGCKNHLGTRSSAAASK